MKIVKLIKEFLEYKKLIEGLDVRKLDERIRLRIKEADTSLEKEINEVLLFNLARKIITDNVTHEFAQGFKSALLLRGSLKNIDTSIDK